MKSQRQTRAKRLLKRSSKATVTFFLTASVLILNFQNCSKVGFSGTSTDAGASVNGGINGGPGDGSAGGSIADGGTNVNTGDGFQGTIGQPCTDVAAITRQTKIVFVVDTSGSNRTPTKTYGTQDCQSADDPGCSPPTDPNKNFRGGAINNFFTKYQSKSNFDWGFLTFSGASTRSLIANGISARPADMSNAITAFMSILDNGSTPYQTALRLATQTIQNDADLNSAAQPQYVVIFISDGFPSDYDITKDFGSSPAAQDVDTLKAVAPGRVTLSSIYYGTVANPDAITELRNMAARGNGQVAAVNSATSSINIDDVIPGKVCK